jgi:hypothetical protein
LGGWQLSNYILQLATERRKDCLTPSLIPGAQMGSCSPGDDYDLFVRFMQFVRFWRVNRILAAFRVHSLSKTPNHIETAGKEVDAVCRKYRVRHGAGDAVIEEWLTQLVGKYEELRAE